MREHPTTPRPSVPYIRPASLTDPIGRGVRRAPSVAIQESYETQIHVSREGDRRIAMTPTAVSGAGLPAWLPAVRTWFITAWSSEGAPRTLAENMTRTLELRQAVAELGAARVGDVVTVPPDGSWVEDAMVVEGLDVGEAQALGRAFGQPAITALGHGRLAIVPTGTRNDVGPVSLEAEVRPWPSGCPMRPGTQAPCQADGGPWGSAAVHAAALWDTHRSIALPRLGCQICLDGHGDHDPFEGRGAPHLLDQPHLASRYGGYSWHGDTRSSAPPS